MKRIHLSVLLLMVIAAGCRKTYNDTINGQTPDQRITASLTAWQEKLTSAPYGWIFVENTTGIAYNNGVSQNGPRITLAYYMQFTNDNQVGMLSDFDTSMAASLKTSGYRLKALQRPELIFDTYSYLHIPCDPDPAVSKSLFGTGFGWGADFEYTFADTAGAASTGDTIRLLGSLNGAQGQLIKATQGQQNAYLSGGAYQNMESLNSINTIQEYFKRMTVGGIARELKVDPVDRTITFTWLDAGVIRTAVVSYYITGDRINFSGPAVGDTLSFTGIDNIYRDPTTSALTATIGGESGTISGFPAPLQADVSAPQRWRQYAISNGLVWVTDKGFHGNGVDDIFGITNYSDPTGTYLFFAYLPEYGGVYDLFVPVTVGSTGGLNLGANGLATSDPPTYTSDGRIIFSYFGARGTLNKGTPVYNTSSVLLDTGGFYLIEKDASHYDMVSATNDKFWISWYSHL